MALNTSAVLNASLAWSVLDTGTNGQNQSIIDNSQVLSNQIFVTGTGTQNIIDTVFYAADTFDSSKLYDLYALSKNVLGYASTVNLSGVNVKCLIFKNTSTGTQQIDIYFSGASYFDGFLGGQDLIKLRKNAVFIISDPLNGFPVNNDNRYINMIEIGSGSARVEIGIIGQRV